jgi:uncharacterized protein YndB with AHSA1/START domain
MKDHVHVFDAREGGRFRISLTYQDPGHSPCGKTSENTDTFHGRFIELVRYEKIVEAIAFETRDPRFAGKRKITTSLPDTGGALKSQYFARTCPRAFGPKTTKSAANHPCRTWPRSLSSAAKLRSASQVLSPCRVRGTVITFPAGPADPP